MRAEAVEEGAELEHAGSEELAVGGDDLHVAFLVEREAFDRLAVVELAHRARPQRLRRQAARRDFLRSQVLDGAREVEAEHRDEIVGERAQLEHRFVLGDLRARPELRTHPSQKPVGRHPAELGPGGEHGVGGAERVRVLGFRPAAPEERHQPSRLGRETRTIRGPLRR